LVLKGEIDPEWTSFHYRPLMFPLLERYGVELVYSVGFGVLGYPPTWVDLEGEARMIEVSLRTKANA
jgi:hypothetical protein